MDLNEQLNRLMVLQSTEDEVKQLEKDKNNLQIDIVNQQKTVAELENNLEEIHQKRINNQKIADSLEVKIQSAKDENEKLRTQLNTTKNQSDYDKIRKNIMSNQADIERWEDEELTAFETVDKLVEAEAEMKSEIASEKNKLHEISSEVKQDIEKYDSQIAELNKKKESIRAQIDSRLLSKYEQIAKSNKKRPLVKVEKRICRGCFTRVPKQIENELMRCNEPVFCHSCGRLLMMGESSIK